ncbi:hypothetical protein ACHHYP_14429 [Achlya hypogyna]|uniref:Uncharacterized protein n=1 Tax=Achlya hypogyna TaxID=1202772 RepID=A0A1V9YD18_ACHHY|nr:hypothetical protein ACHHYP_14429 [Achlya hypogyna]
MEGGEEEVELIAPRSRHRYFRPQVPLYEVVSYDGHFEVRERPARAAVAARAESKTSHVSPYKATSKKRPRPQSSHRAVRAVHNERAKTSAVRSPRTLEPLAQEPAMVPPPAHPSSVPPALLEAQVLLREGIVRSMIKLCRRPGLVTSPTNIIQLVQLCQRLRQHTMEIVESIAMQGKSFVYQGGSYLAKMATDTDFLNDVPVLLQALGVASLRSNPLLCAVPLTFPALAAYVVFRRQRDRDALVTVLRDTNELEEDRLVDALVLLSQGLGQEPVPPTPTTELAANDESNSDTDFNLEPGDAGTNERTGDATPPRPPPTAFLNSARAVEVPTPKVTSARDEAEVLDCNNADDNEYDIGVTFSTVTSLCNAMQEDLKSRFGIRPNNFIELDEEDDPVDKFRAAPPEHCSIGV